MCSCGAGPQSSLCRDDGGWGRMCVPKPVLSAWLHPTSPGGCTEGLGFLLPGNLGHKRKQVLVSFT